LDLAQCESLLNSKDWKELLVTARRLSASRRFAEEAFRYFAKAAVEEKAWAELDKVAQARVTANSMNSAAMGFVVQAQLGLKHPDVAATWAKKMSSTVGGGNETRNYLAWQRMLAGTADEEVLAGFTDSGTNPGSHRNGDTESLYTMAALQVLLNKTDDAQQSLRQAVSTGASQISDARAWVVYGKLCEKYGFSDDAKKAWQRARADEGSNQLARWSLSLISATN